MDTFSSCTAGPPAVHVGRPVVEQGRGARVDIAKLSLLNRVGSRRCPGAPTQQRALPRNIKADSRAGPGVAEMSMANVRPDRDRGLKPSRRIRIGVLGGPPRIRSGRQRAHRNHFSGTWGARRRALAQPAGALKGRLSRNFPHLPRNPQVLYTGRRQADTGSGHDGREWWQPRLSARSSQGRLGASSVVACGSWPRSVGVRTSPGRTRHNR